MIDTPIPNENDLDFDESLIKDEENEKILYFWDIKRQKYVGLLKDTQEIQIIEKEHIKRYFYNKSPENWKFIKDTLFLEDKTIKNRYLTFEPLKEQEWKQNGFIYRNTFIESQISLKATETRSQGLLTIKEDLLFMDNYPHIKALLNNLCSKDEYLEYFINWLSCALATKKKIGTSIFFRGIPGTGKGVLWEQLICYFVGDNYVQVLENDTLKSNFTPKGLEKSLFVLANEIKADFRDGNNTYEKLKMYITDSTLRIEEKGVQAFNAPNHFNLILFSNNDVPLQIQGGDRRYSIFATKSRTLAEVAKVDFGLTVDLFIKEIQKERDNFLIDLICFSYSFDKARKCLETEEKERIYRASMTKIEILGDKVKKFDKSFFENDICEILEQMTEESKEELYTKNNIVILNDDELTIKNLFDDMQKFAFEFQCLKNSHLVFLYQIFVDDKATLTKLGTALNSHFGKSETISIHNKKFRVRKVAEFKEKDFLEKLIPF